MRQQPGERGAIAEQRLAEAAGVELCSDVDAARVREGRGYVKRARRVAHIADRVPAVGVAVEGEIAAERGARSQPREELRRHAQERRDRALGLHAGVHAQKVAALLPEQPADSGGVAVVPQVA